MKTVITYFLLLLPSFFYGKTEKLPIDTVLFSSDSKYVLAFDFFIDAYFQKQVWHLYDKENLDDKFNMNIFQSILFEEGDFYAANYINTDDSSEVIKNNKIKIKDFLRKYKLVDVANEITNDVNFKITICDSLNWEEELSNELFFGRSNKVVDYKIKINYILNTNDTFYIFHLPKVSALLYSDFQDNLNTFLKQLNTKRPEEIYDEEVENLLKGVRKFYTTIFYSSKNQYFINSNFAIDNYLKTEIENVHEGVLAYSFLFNSLNFQIRTVK
ncbi:MAG: hypothetical protein CVT95_00295 [Bacteroidetes bacterium HGW-Bacteroidetes-12]|nr:MAG: hypothetical protein CVT95_00295 [Bacteroidetes bacterium HGW-Bacteroidetes-12]